jgi:hypothetical protein
MRKARRKERKKMKTGDEGEAEVKKVKKKLRSRRRSAKPKKRSPLKLLANKTGCSVALILLLLIRKLLKLRLLNSEHS